MKILYSFLTVFFSFIGYCQTILNQAETASRTVQDSNAVVLAQGFHAASSVSNPFVAKIGASSETPTNPTNSDAGSTNPSGQVGNTSLKFHDTTGNIDVNGGGQLQYTLPIALPPGVKSVAPQVNLVYTSGSGNGIAGYGWSISGITAISRVGKNIEKDGEVRGVKMDYSDYYSFNGQRLILKSGEYGKDGAEYVTEKYSNVKIKSLGSISGQQWQGPEYWEVTFEDGSQAWYGGISAGTSAARTPMEYNIVKWKDAQGNFITYNYTQTSNVAMISSIQWGGNETLGKSHFNEIVFTYQTRSLVESSYVNGIQFLQGKSLDNITVYCNSNLFKKYKIEYGKDLSISRYEYVNNIKEFNSNNEESNPVYFQKSEIPYIAKRQDLSANLISENQTFGDFDGDGRVDLLYYNGGSPGYYECLDYDDYGYCSQQGNYIEATGGGTYVVFNKFDGNNAPVKVSDEDLSKGIVIGGVLDGENKLTTSQGIVTYKESNDTLATRKLTLKTYVLSNNAFVMVKQKEIPTLSYDSSYKIPENPKPFEPNSTSSTSLGSFKTLDLNGDGLSELIFTAIDYICNSDVFDPNCDQPQNKSAPSCWETRCHTNYRSFVIDLNIDNSQNAVSRINLGEDIKDLDFIDFDGDGKTDILRKYETGLNWYSDFKKNYYGYYTAERSTYASFNGELAGLQYGDFNGDGKLDFAVPEKGVDETSNWRIYTNTGTNIFKEQYLSNFLIYRKYPYQSTNNTKRQVIYYTFTKDLNNDGKDDFINVQSETFRKHQVGANRDSDYDLKIKINEGADATGNIVFRETYTDHIDSTKEDHFVPINISARIYGIDRFIMIKHGNNRLFTYDYFNLPISYTVNRIDQSGTSTSIKYNELDAGNTNTVNFYQSKNDYTYPYGTLKNIISKSVVTQLQQAGRLQDFRYRSLISHFQGRGIMGFNQVARSTWYAIGFENTKVWNGAEMDPLKSGAPYREWTIHTNNESQIFPADLSVNNSSLSSFKQTEYTIDYLLNNSVVNYPSTPTPNLVTAMTPIKITEKDFLKNTTSIKTIEYGDYYLPKKTITNIDSGFATSINTLEYSHNLSASGKDYHVGRPKSKTESMSVYGDHKSSKQEYTYNSNNLLETQKTYNRDNTGWLKEDFTYDDFGNVTKKEITNSIDTYKKSDETTFDDKGRFVISKIDNLGLTTTIEYNDWGQIKTQTDPLGNKLNNTYDGWGKLLTAKTNLGGTSTHSYEKLSNGDTKVVAYEPDGGIKITYTNTLGQNYKSSVKGFATNTYISVSTNYDVLGRKIAESEPYFGDTPPPFPTNITYDVDVKVPGWNIIKFNDNVFPAKIKTISFNNKQAESSADGLVATVKELNGYRRTTSKTSDALGNIVSSTDKGGTITFKYNAAGENTEANYGGNIVKTSYDAWGNKTRFEDPANGVYTYEYNGYFGMLSKSISPKGTKSYTYNGKGQLVSQREISTDGSTATDKTITFAYNDNGMLTNKSGTSKGKAFSSYINYDALGRVISSGENSNDRYYLQKGLTYDDKGRVTSYEKSLYSAGVLTKVTIENLYSSWSGALYQVKDKSSNKVLWELQDTNAKGQVKKVQLGGTTIDNSYDANGFLSSVLHTGNAAHNSILSVIYNFDAVKNELKSRNTGGDFNIQEQFDYDDNNRLVNWTDPVTNIKPSAERNVYDIKGRITTNDQVGTFKFGNSQKIYQPTSMVLNDAGTQNYNNDLLQKITYNENNDPVFIDGVKGDVRFEYGLTSMRQRVTYGGNFDKNGDGKFTKYYSEDGSYEIIRNNQTGQEKHMLYIGDTPYDSNIVYLKNYAESTGSYKFLHKDYLGSILAITDEAGNKLEQRHFDAWGNLTHLKIGMQATITDKNQIRDYLSGGNLILDRGYTSHEHFAEVGLIHMNGRLYDPLLRRFLNADENIQEPYNTQNYNKYGYVLNNPLMFNDPTGELFGLDDFLAAVIIGAVVGALTYSAGVLISGTYWNIGSFLKSTIFGAISGAVTFGIGSAFTPAAGTVLTLGQEIVSGVAQGVVHGFAQGILSLVQGGSFEQAFVSGALGSLGASAWGMGMKAMGFANAAKSAIGTIGFGALSGGVGSALSDGNFWQGAVIGGMVAGLNHVAHQMTGPGDPPGKNSSQQKQPWDLNGDGILQKNEADSWWLTGKGADIWVDNSLIDWTGLEMPLNTSIGKTFSIDTHTAFVDLPYETASTYGGTSFVRTGERTASVIDQKYHYDYRPNNSVKNVIRNFMNWYGKPSLPWPNNIPRLQGVDYMIHYQNPQIKFK